jgi:hypothetical protein
MLKRTSFAWTPEDEARLIELAENGFYRRNIALPLRRFESGIKKRAHNLALSVKTTPRRHFSV